MRHDNMATSTIKKDYVNMLPSITDDSKVPSDYPLGITLEGGDSTAGMPARYGVLITVKTSTARAAQIAVGYQLAAVRTQDTQTAWLSWQSII